MVSHLQSHVSLLHGCLADSQRERYEGDGNLFVMLGLDGECTLCLYEHEQIKIRIQYRLATLSHFRGETGECSRLSGTWKSPNIEEGGRISLTLA
jgi:hypothetical protein